MPRITDIEKSTERRIDLSAFFGEDAFVTIKRLGKYQFTFLLNKNRGSYTAKLYDLMADWRLQNPGKVLEGAEYNVLKKSISVAEAEEMIKIENEVDKEYYRTSIMPNKHNFTDADGKLLELSGDWFYDLYANLVDDKSRKTLNDVMISEIVDFNHKGIVLGEQTDSRSTVS